MVRFTSLVLAVLTLLALSPVARADKNDKAAKAAADADTDFEPETVERGAPPSSTLIRAKKLYDKGDYYAATIEFDKVTHGETGDSEANKQAAQYFIAKTLYNMGFYAASLARFDEIVEAGPAHTYYRKTLEWLAALAEKLPESAGILDKIGMYSPDDLEDKIFDQVRPHLYLLLGKHYYAIQDGTPESLQKAIDMFEKVPEDSEYFLEAKFLESVCWVLVPDGEKAVDALKQLMIIAREPALRKKYPSDEVHEYEERAYLTMARIFYSTKQYDTAIRYFEKIPQDSPDWLDSLFEASWAYYERTPQMPSKALGNIHTLNAPYFQSEFFPESLILKAQIYYNYCRYDRAQEALDEFTAVYPAVRDDIRKIIAQSPDDDGDFFTYIQKVRTNTAGLSDATQRITLSALQDKTLQKSFDYVDELNKELKQLDNADKAWKSTRVAVDMRQDLVLNESQAEADAGKLARQRLSRLEEELTFMVSDSRGVRIAILDRQEEAKKPNAPPPVEGKQDPIIVDDQHETWDFSGEYWIDELGFYRYKISSNCPANMEPDTTSEPTSTGQ